TRTRTRGVPQYRSSDRSIGERRSQEVKMTHLQFRQFEAEVDFHASRFGFAEHAQEGSEVEDLLILNERGFVDMREFFGPLDGRFPAAQFIDESQFVS